MCQGFLRLTYDINIKQGKIPPNPKVLANLRRKPRRLQNSMALV
jgi:hypothetical protein